MVVKQKRIWCCIECGHKQTRWGGQCPACQEWNSLAEEVEVVSSAKRFESQKSGAGPVQLTGVKMGQQKRLKTGIFELDRLLGEGLVKGSLTLIGGDPGIGKSTLLLQAADALARQGLVVLYICCEESVEQTSMRALRLGVESDKIYLLNETQFSLVKAQIDQLSPDVIIADSIQMLYKNELPSAPGSVTQVREVAMEFLHIAKGRGIATLLIGHVTKSGEIAGPRVLEHIVDTVLYFEGDRQNHYRMLRVVKNRFGATDEIAIFEMAAEGLREVENPSELFLQERVKHTTGSVIIPTLEGTRPILVELQSLVTDTVFATPSRRSTGIDQNRLALLLAVLEKRLGYPLHRCDVFSSAVGGIKINEPAVDLGILLSIASSFCNIALDPSLIVMGEVGLGGEVRRIPRIEKRIKEAVSMGFKSCLIPKRNHEGLSTELLNKIEVHCIENVEEAIHATLV
ncbi:DNA repair protein RadA [Simkania negevensis]|uniref:DNA repair protein RadA n=1 Tax=Simkania negevensis TaxID=83561 RepID=A0ABS3AQY4_9BACT|nr:DNA repair protein RadA [Simkania negevensis]